MTLWSQKLAQTYYQYLEYAITAHFNISFLLTLALNTMTYVMTLLVSVGSNSSPQPDRNHGTL